MSSPVKFDGTPFNIENVVERQFHILGPSVENKGILHTAFLSKPVFDTLSIPEPPTRLNGFCQYAFLHSVGGICGFILLTPIAQTKVSSISVSVGAESETYLTHHHLAPQGVLILESTDSSTLFISLEVNSSLLVKVDL